MAHSPTVTMWRGSAGSGSTSVRNRLTCNVHQAAVAEVVVAPDALQQVFPRQHLAGVGGQLARTRLWMDLALALDVPFVYADLLSFFRPGDGRDQRRQHGPGRSQRRLAPHRRNRRDHPRPDDRRFRRGAFPLVRRLSLGVGVLEFSASVSNRIGESWANYLFFGVLKIGLAGRRGLVLPLAGWEHVGAGEPVAKSGASWRAYCTDVWLSGWRSSKASAGPPLRAS